jgi:Protein of unknown function (DUF3987)
MTDAFKSDRKPGDFTATVTEDKAGTSTAGSDSAPRPSPLRPDFSNFPPELTSLSNWVLWRYLPPKSGMAKWRKVPFQPNGKTASTTDRSTWSSFDDCCVAYTQGGFDGVGFVFDGEVGADGLCYCGVDFDACIDENRKIQSLAGARVKRLKTYAECSVSGTGLHCIARAKPLDRIVKYDGVEIYSEKRFFTFTGGPLGGAFGKIESAEAEIQSLVDEVRAKEASAKKQFTNNTKSNDCSGSSWIQSVSPEKRDQIVDHALAMIAQNSCLLESEANGGNNAEYFKLTTSVARSGAPHAEDIFVKYASRAKAADPEEELRGHFARCGARSPSGDQAITVGTLLHLARQNGANFDAWKCQTQQPQTATEPSFVDPYAEFVGPVFPFDVLPPTLARFVDAEYRAMGADPSAIAMAALTAVSGAMHAETRVRVGEGWPEKPILWTVLIGPPSAMKSPIIDKVVKPLFGIDQERQKLWLQAYAISQKTKGTKKGPPPAMPPRCVINDGTSEKVAELLSRDPSGSLMVHDELAGWLGSFERYNSGSSRAFALSCWNGGTFLKDRVGRGKQDTNAEIRVENLALSVLGGIQPDRLAKLGDLTSDGLLQRFLTVLMKSAERGDQYHPVATADADYEKLIRSIVDVPPQNYHFEDEAFEIRDRVLDYLHMLEMVDGFPPSLIGAIGKLKGYFARICLVLHVAERHDPAASYAAPSEPLDSSFTAAAGESLLKLMELSLDESLSAGINVSSAISRRTAEADEKLVREFFLLRLLRRCGERRPRARKT